MKAYNTEPLPSRSPHRNEANASHTRKPRRDASSSGSVATPTSRGSQISYEEDAPKNKAFGYLKQVLKERASKLSLEGTKVARESLKQAKSPLFQPWIEERARFVLSVKEPSRSLNREAQDYQELEKCEEYLKELVDFKVRERARPHLPAPDALQRRCRRRT